MRSLVLLECRPSASSQPPTNDFQTVVDGRCPAKRCSGSRCRNPWVGWSVLPGRASGPSSRVAAFLVVATVRVPGGEGLDRLYHVAGTVPRHNARRHVPLWKAGASRPSVFTFRSFECVRRICPPNAPFFRQVRSHEPPGGHVPPGGAAGQVRGMRRSPTRRRGSRAADGADGRPAACDAGAVVPLGWPTCGSPEYVEQDHSHREAGDDRARASHSKPGPCPRGQGRDRADDGPGAPGRLPRVCGDVRRWRDRRVPVRQYAAGCWRGV